MTLMIIAIALVLFTATLAARRISVHRRQAHADQRERQSRAVRESLRSSAAGVSR
jgi:hypothetical protein